MTGIAEAAAVGLAAGVLSGLFGVGGGILFVPALLFVSDLSQIEATATSLAAMLPVVWLGAWVQHRARNVRRRPAVVIGLASAGGVAGGAALAEALPDDALRRLFAVFLLFVAVRLAWSVRRSPTVPDA